jgi:4-hydroxy-tetrahydrodipicolinate reductase
MGMAVENASRSADDFQVKARVDRTAPDGPGPSVVRAEYKESPAGNPAANEVLPPARLAGLLSRGDVVIEFSSPEGARLAAQASAERGAALVSGSTGLAAADEAAIARASGAVPVLRAANFSLGVLALRRAFAAAAQALPRGWDIEIIERHHRRKSDSPSGTALMLAREGARLRGYPAESIRHGRSGPVGPRPGEEIGVHAVRGGTWVGDHAVLLAGEGEWIELRHIAEDRSAFAHGVLAAARFVARAAPGLYTLEDVISPPSRTT